MFFFGACGALYVTPCDTLQKNNHNKIKIIFRSDRIMRRSDVRSPPEVLQTKTTAGLLKLWCGTRLQTPSFLFGNSNLKKFFFSWRDLQALEGVRWDQTSEVLVCLEISVTQTPNLDLNSNFSKTHWYLWEWGGGSTNAQKHRSSAINPKGNAYFWITYCSFSSAAMNSWEEVCWCNPATVKRRIWHCTFG